MTTLAIRGHATRSKEVIEILEMLGGKSCTVLAYKGEDPNRFYCINKYSNFIDSPLVLQDVQIFSLEEFLEKYPYKKGDNVILSDYESPLEIVGMKWENNSIKYEVYTNDYGYWFSVDELQPYKEETMEDIIKIDIPKGYEFVGVDDDKQQVVFTKIQPKYPKTYEECIGQLPINWDGEVKGYKRELLLAFQKLLIARDVYWKIAGEQMGLGKPWKPDWDDENEFKYGLYHFRNGIIRDGSCINPTLLAFPTEEMRDTFYENFGYLIEICKELL